MEIDTAEKRRFTARRALLIALVVLVIVIVLIFAYSYSSTSPRAFQVSAEVLEMAQSAKYSSALGITVTNRGDATLTSVTVWLNGYSMGSCLTNLLPGHFTSCGFARVIPCTVLAGGLPYSMKAQATFQDGQNETITWSETPNAGSPSGGC